MSKLRKVNMVRESLASKKVRNNSFAEGLAIQPQRNEDRKSKVHKASLGDDLASKASTHDSSLQRRVRVALEKTQSAFRLYEGLHRRGAMVT
jgi:hypothetical protein